MLENACPIYITLSGALTLTCLRFSFAFYIRTYNEIGNLQEIELYRKVWHHLSLFTDYFEYSPAAASLQATAATIAAPLPLPSSDSFITIPLPGAISSMAARILEKEEEEKEEEEEEEEE